MGSPETFYGIRRADGEDMGDYSWVSTSGPDDWEAAETDAECADEATDYELVRFDVVEVARRRFGPEVECDGWEGEDEYPARSWVAVVVQTDGTQETYPARDVPLKHCDTQEEADAFIAALPETLYILPTYGHLTEIRRDRLTTEAQGYKASPGRCEKCGRSKYAHPTPSSSSQEETPE